MEFPFKFIQLFNLALSFVIILIIGRLCLHNYGQLRYQVFTTGGSNILSQWSLYCLELCLFVPELSWKRNRFLETLNNWQKHKWSETSYSRATGVLFFLYFLCFFLYFKTCLFYSVFYEFFFFFFCFSSIFTPNVFLRTFPHLVHIVWYICSHLRPANAVLFCILA